MLIMVLFVRLPALISEWDATKIISLVDALCMKCIVHGVLSTAVFGTTGPD